MQNEATTVNEYLSQLPPDRRDIISKVREVILKHLPKGYSESMQWGMIGYGIPLSRYPKGYLNNSNVPLCYVSLGSQKNYMSLYLMNVYGDKTLYEWFVSEWKKRGKKLDMGKSCVRFKKLDDLQLDVIGQVIQKTSVDEYIDIYEQSRK